jgi:hypothetical protein
MALKTGLLGFGAERIGLAAFVEVSEILAGASLRD